MRVDPKTIFRYVRASSTKKTRTKSATFVMFALRTVFRASPRTAVLPMRPSAAIMPFLRQLSTASGPSFTANNNAKRATDEVQSLSAARDVLHEGSATVSEADSVASHEKTGPTPVTVDRELPDPFAAKKQNRLYFWAYGLGVLASCAIIFNYEKTRSPIINSVLYCLRRSNTCSALLGPNINFRNSWPWIWGTLSTAQGNIDIAFDVKGDRGPGTLRLRAARQNRMHPFDIYEWTLEVDGTTVDLLKDESIEANF